MRWIAPLAISFLVAACTSVGPTTSELLHAGENTDNVLTYGMSYKQQRFSALSQINKSSVQRLAPVWTAPLDNELGEQAQPLVYDGVIYVSNARWTFAFDALSGKELWRTAVDYPPDTPRVVCCGVSNKGVALYQGKVFRTTLDAHVVALDMKTGAIVWKQKAADWKDGYSQTVAPLVANGVVVTGISGAEFGIRGFVDGWDPDTGKHLWRRYTTAGPEDPGSVTWEPREAYRYGGGSTWITGSYDPELDLMYWGTGNAGPWNPVARKGDNLYTASVLAMRPKTGEVIWHYQFTPNDVFDWDAVWEIILADIPVNGQMRKVAMQMNRNGFLYVLDRTNGELLSAKAYKRSPGQHTSTWRPADRSNRNSRRNCVPAKRSRCGRACAAPRTGRTPPSIRPRVCSTRIPITVVRNTTSPSSRLTRPERATRASRTRIFQRSQAISSVISKRSIP